MDSSSASQFRNVASLIGGAAILCVLTGARQTAKNPMDPILECFAANQQATASFLERDFELGVEPGPDRQRYGVLFQQERERPREPRKAWIFTPEQILQVDLSKAKGGEQSFVRLQGSYSGKNGHPRLTLMPGYRVVQFEVLNAGFESKVLKRPRLYFDRDRSPEEFQKFLEDQSESVDWLPATHAVEESLHVNSRENRRPILKGLIERLSRFASRASGASTDDVQKESGEIRSQQDGIDRLMDEKDQARTRLMTKIRDHLTSLGVPGASAQVSIRYEREKDRIEVDFAQETGGLKQDLQVVSPGFFGSLRKELDELKGVESRLGAAQDRLKSSSQRASEHARVMKTEAMLSGLRACKAALERDFWRDDPEFQPLYAEVLKQLRLIEAKRASGAGAQPDPSSGSGSTPAR